MSHKFHSAIINLEQLRTTEAFKCEPAFGRHMFNVFCAARAAVAGVTHDFGHRARTNMRIPNSGASDTVWIHRDPENAGNADTLMDKLIDLHGGEDGLVTTDDFLNPERAPTPVHSPLKMELYATVVMAEDVESCYKTVVYFFFNLMARDVKAYIVTYPRDWEGWSFEGGVMQGIHKHSLFRADNGFLREAQDIEDFLTWFGKYTGL